MTHNEQAFVLLETSSIRRPPATAAERRTKVEILFKSSIVNVKLGQKAEQRYVVERRFASHPNGTNAMLCAGV